MRCVFQRLRDGDWARCCTTQGTVIRVAPRCRPPSNRRSATPRVDAALLGKRRGSAAALPAPLAGGGRCSSPTWPGLLGCQEMLPLVLLGVTISPRCHHHANALSNASIAALFFTACHNAAFRLSRWLRWLLAYLAVAVAFALSLILLPTPPTVPGPGLPGLGCCLYSCVAHCTCRLSMGNLGPGGSIRHRARHCLPFEGNSRNQKKKLRDSGFSAPYGAPATLLPHLPHEAAHTFALQGLEIEFCSDSSRWLPEICFSSFTQVAAGTAASCRP